MDISTIACNECGAPLQVPDSARFVTCEHCSSQLEIRRREGAAWTEVVQRLARGQEKLEQRVMRLEGKQLRRRRPFRRRRPEEDATGPQLLEGLFLLALVPPALAWEAGSPRVALVMALCIGIVVVLIGYARSATRAKRDRARAERKRARRQARS